MNRFLTIGAALLLSLVLMACTDPVIIEGCTSSDEVHIICGFERPEDLEPLGGHPWILISELGSADIPGQIVALNVDDGTVTRLEATVAEPDPNSTFPRCGPPPDRLRPRGFHVSDLAGGGFRLLVVNIAGSQRIERYRIDVTEEGPQIAWQGCVTVPDTLSPNDVAALSSDNFVISHMYDPPRTAWHTAQFFLGLDTGYAVAWSPQTEWTKVPGTGSPFPNGVEADPLTDRVFIGSTYGQIFIAADAFGDNARTIRIPVQSDNITWAPDGRILSVGHTGIPLLGTNGCQGIGSKPCAFPFAVVAIDPDTLAQEILYEHQDGLIPGASVALLHKGFLYMGTFFGDRISRVRLEE
jgi:hypothetical protein